MIIDNKYTIRHKVLTENIDGKCRATPMEFAILVQELAAGHYSCTGLSIPHLQRMSLTWVITKQHFEITEYPLWMDDLIVQTWAQTPKGIFCLRDFAFFYAKKGKKNSIDDAFAENLRIEEGKENLYSIKEEYKELKEPIFRASSCWVILNSETGQPVKPDTKVFGNLAFNEEHLEGKVFAKIQLPETWNIEEPFRPTLLDIDVNSHVNNLTYLRWILSYMSADFCKGKLLKTLDTNFLSSAMYGEDLICRSSRSENVCIHSIIRAKDGSEVFKARSEWADEKKLSRTLQVSSN
ncbi:acyl-[acyl-carrier-protein] thioesterase [Treponema putidum]|uniref:acyl-[acyl-carrier-protein] thioesterase n=1 Tax=Treponema putidum TaxID=221027 RepID=UPI002102D817|nr:acyl-ACP thioesterase domain-containing protein [Treponema putidum]UTY30533.1 hypothetical protein E4N75_02455 [Treponema putidum]